MIGGESIRRDRMVTQLAGRGIRSRPVLDAIRSIPRESFVEEWLRGQAYREGALPIGEKQTISQPWIVARMTELAEPTGSGRVLEIGTGSGYHAAVLSRLYDHVFRDEDFPAGIRVERIKGAGHFTHQEMPEEVNRLLLGWFIACVVVVPLYPVPCICDTASTSEMIVDAGPVVLTIELLLIV